jgi:UDP:flavonoid glycosyltransferase YjiC (YdhE family)
VLGAIAHGAPLVTAPGGSGTEEIAEACARFGNAIVPVGPATLEREITDALDRIIAEPAVRSAAGRLQKLFAAYDGPANVCRELEQLAAAPAAIGGTR